MNTNDELFTSFLMSAVTTDNDWTSGVSASSLWVRSPEVRNWRCVVEKADPYELLPMAVSMTPTIGDREAMLFMYGWATPTEPEEGSERVRVRITLHLHQGRERMAVQFQGETLEEFEDGGGMFRDNITDLRAAQLCLNEMDCTNQSMITAKAVEMATVRILNNMFHEGEQ